PRHEDAPVVFPYPRNLAFRASIDIASVAPLADLAKVQVRAFDAEGKLDLGPAEFKVEQGRLWINFSKPDAGRYVVTW
ncbi:MAG: hypothetical protein M1608_00985, partial [Candidatus Omnitrophica bacterium]|nr:hypothetical protein [Candidatus Omnitrophota bacterium]